MENYLKVKDAGEPYYLPVESDNTIYLETLQSAFPSSCGLCFYIKNKCFVVKLQRGVLYLPKEWWKFCYEPIFDDDYDEYEDEDEYDNEYEDDEYYQTDDHDKTNIGVKPPQKEDINELYFNLLNEKNDENDYDNSDYDDDEVWQF